MQSTELDMANGSGIKDPYLWPPIVSVVAPVWGYIPYRILDK